MLDLNAWKQNVSESLQGWPEKFKGSSANFTWSFLAGTALWPLAGAFAGDPSVLWELPKIISSVGAGLIGSRLNEWKNKANAEELAQTIEEDVRNDDKLYQAIDDLFEMLYVIQEAKAKLSDEDRVWFEEKLEQEKAERGHVITQTAKAGPKSKISQTAIGDALSGETVVKELHGDLNIYQAAQPDPPSPTPPPKPPTPPPSDLPSVRAAYLKWIADRFQFLDIKGMGVRELSVGFPLEKVYVDLKARADLPDADTEQELTRVARKLEPDQLKEFHLAGRKLSEQELESVGRKLNQTEPLMELFKRSQGLIILGDPGSGKTTFLRYLALCLAEGKAGEVGVEGRLPIFLPLSAYANALTRNQDVRLHDYLSDYYSNERELNLPLGELFEDSLENGNALLLFDGLDEVREETSRKLIAEKVMDFCCGQVTSNNRFVMTSRIIGYREVRPNAGTVQECTLLDFDDDSIASFAEKWTAAFEEVVKGDTQSAGFDAAREREELLDAVRHNDGVRRLAANPLLLTILALMKRQGINLPEKRVDLYRIYVETLLKTWNAQRGAPDLSETEEILAPLAWRMQEISPGVGLVAHDQVIEELTDIYSERGEGEPGEAAKKLLSEVRKFTGLLLERGAGTYGFIHLTFQEYLAAVNVHLHSQGSARKAANLLMQHLGADHWHEVSLLAVGNMGINHKLKEVAGEVLELIIKQGEENGRRVDAILLAGESAADVQKAGLSDASLDAIKEALRTELSRSDGTTAKERVHAGHILGRLGDPREEVTTLEEMQFCLVPGGPFMMGGSDENALEDEKPAGEYDELSYSYWMGRFPVTNAQFGKFVEAKGYEIEEIWKEARDAQRWEGGRFVDDPDYFENDPRTGPVSYGEPYDLPNHPVVGVTWYECLAFSRWLTQEWQREHGLAEDWAFRLPTEPEWEKAARGGINIPTENQRRKLSQVALLMRPGGLSDAEAQANPNPGRTYPWGHAAELDTASSEHLNFNETQIGSTNAVGSFPLGVSVFGSEEMSGGVLEWCLNRSADYPYEPGDGREEIDEKMDSRVLRGGSFASDSRFVRCAYRGRDVPDFRINCIGFRLCLSPISSSLISEPSDL